MPNEKISELTALVAAAAAAGDLLPIADVSAAETKSIRADVLLDAILRLSADGVVSAQSVMTLTAATNNWSAGVGLFTRFQGDAARTVTGEVAGADGEIRFGVNVGNYPITFAHNTTSTAANRYSCAGGADTVVGPGEVVLRHYWAAAEDAEGRWLVTKVRSDVAQGTVIVRQPGGVAGTDELQLYDDGSDSIIQSKQTSAVRLRFHGGTTRLEVLRNDGSTAAQVYAQRFCASDGSDRIYMTAVDGNASYIAMTQGSYVAWTSNDNDPGSGKDTSIYKLAPLVLGIGTGAASGAGWLQNTAGRARVTADVTNATTTYSTITDLTLTLIAGRKYAGKLVVKCNDSTAAEGIKFTFGGGTATMTSFWAAASAPVGGTTVLGNAISTALGTTINYTTITGETIIEINFSMVVNAGGTFIPRFAQNSHTSGTATVELGSVIMVEDMP